MAVHNKGDNEHLHCHNTEMEAYQDPIGGNKSSGSAELVLRISFAILQ